MINGYVIDFDISEEKFDTPEQKLWSQQPELKRFVNQYKTDCLASVADQMKNTEELRAKHTFLMWQLVDLLMCQTSTPTRVCELNQSKLDNFLAHFGSFQRPGWLVFMARNFFDDTGTLHRWMFPGIKREKDCFNVLKVGEVCIRMAHSDKTNMIADDNQWANAIPLRISCKKLKKGKEYLRSFAAKTVWSRSKQAWYWQIHDRETPIKYHTLPAAVAAFIQEKKLAYATNEWFNLLEHVNQSTGQPGKGFKLFQKQKQKLATKGMADFEWEDYTALKSQWINSKENKKTPNGLQKSDKIAHMMTLKTPSKLSAMRSTATKVQDSKVEDSKEEDSKEEDNC